MFIYIYIIYVCVCTCVHVYTIIYNMTYPHYRYIYIHIYVTNIGIYTHIYVNRLIRQIVVFIKTKTIKNNMCLQNSYCFYKQVRYTAKYAGRKTNKKTQTQIYKQRQKGTHTHSQIHGDTDLDI